MSSDRFDDNPNLPPWLRAVPLPPRPRDADAGGQPAASSEEVILPSWLQESQPEAPAASSETDVSGGPRGESRESAPAQTQDQGTLPDWLRAMPAAGPPSGAEPLPTWLNDQAGSTPAPEVPASPASERNLPAWLRDTQGSSASSAESEPLPAWLSDLTEDMRLQEPDATAPDWLRGLAAAHPAAADDQASQPQPQDRGEEPPAPSDATEMADRPSPYETSALPDWLRDAGAVGQELPSGPTLPDLWSSDASPPAEPGPPPSGEHAESVGEPATLTPDEASMPSWLREIAPEDAGEELAVEPFSFEGATGTRPETDAAGPPAWLAGAAGAEELAETTPDWLKDTSGGAAEPPERPLWLQDFGQQGEVAPAAPAPVPNPELPAVDESLPTWLQSAGEEPPAESTPAWLQEQDATKPPVDEGIPEWLRLGAPETLSASAALAADAETLPGVARPGAPGAPAEPEIAAPAPADDLPEWLRAGSVAAPVPEAASGQDLPPWLRDEAGEPLPTAGEPGDANLPAWLRGAPLAAAALSATGAEPAAPTDSDWLGEGAPTAASPAAESEFFGSTELPAWLRTPETEPAKEISPADARSLDWLTRLGGQEEEESASAVALAPKLTAPAPPTRSAAQVAALGLLERLAADPFPDAAPVPARAEPSIWRRIGVERLLYLALLIALIAALVSPTPGWLGLVAPPSAPGAVDLFAQIDRLGASDIVLVGYEWDARRSGELRPLEQAVLGHLIQRKVKLVLVSTDPQGTLLLFDLRDGLARAGYKPNGEDYILLGYKPGAELALRSLAQDFQAALRSDFQGNDATVSALATEPATGQPRLPSLSSFAMILVLGDEASDVQGWMEQVHRSAPQVPLGFLLPAETTPIVQPYLRQPGIFHLAGGQGALAYQGLRGDSGMPASQVAAAATQQRASILIYIVLFLIGAIVVGVSSAVARGRKRA